MSKLVASLFIDAWGGDLEKSVLLVDDDAAVLELLEDFFLEEGYRVVTAKNGEEALEKYDLDFKGIVVTDMAMPGMDGIELLKRLKKKDPDCIGIILTGHGDMETYNESLCGELAYEYFLKPLDNLDILLVACKRAFKKRASFLNKEGN